MKHSLRLIAAAMLAATALSAPVARAETPPDTLIQAWAIDDIISLDPAEVFEFSASEILGNIYQRLIAYDVDERLGPRGRRRRELGGRRRTA